jgi:prepilin-type processing-associated H-X9-DG protein
VGYYASSSEITANFDTYNRLFWTTTASPNNYIASNLGMLLTTGYLGSEDINYLVNNYQNPNFAPVRYDPELPVSDLASYYGGHSNGQWAVFDSSYLFNPHYTWTTAIPNGGTWTSGTACSSSNGDYYPLVSWYTKVASFDPYKALACDMLYDPTSVAHKRPGTWVFNLAFIDGHVTSVSDKILIKTAPNGGAITTYQGYSVRMPSAVGLPGLDDSLDMLEAEADGRSAITSGGDPANPPMSKTAPFLYRLGSGNPGTSSSYKPLVPWE